MPPNKREQIKIVSFLISELNKKSREISNNVVCATSKASDQPVRIRAVSHEYSLTVRLLTEHHLVFFSFKAVCTGSSESVLVKMPHCWKSHVTAHMLWVFKRTIQIRLFST